MVVGICNRQTLDTRPIDLRLSGDTTNASMTTWSYARLKSLECWTRTLPGRLPHASGCRARKDHDIAEFWQTSTSLKDATSLSCWTTYGLDVSGAFAKLLQHFLKHTVYRTLTALSALPPVPQYSIRRDLLCLFLTAHSFSCKNSLCASFPTLLEQFALTLPTTSSSCTTSGSSFS